MNPERASEASKPLVSPAGWKRRLTRRPPPPVNGHTPAPPAGEAPAGIEAPGPGQAPPPAAPPALTAPVAGPWPAPEPAPPVSSGEHVPVRTILAAIGIVLAAAAGIELILALQRVIGMVVIAGFLAVVLSPAVSGLVRIGVRRSFATAIVFLVGLAALGGLGYLFIHPLYSQAVKFGNNLPDLLAKTQAGKGPLGNLIAKYHLQKTAAQQIPKIRRSIGNLGGPAISLVKSLVAGIGGLIAVMVLTFLMLLEGPGLLRSMLSTLPPEPARRTRRILDDVARSVTGYMVGNTSTSVIAGIVCMVALMILGVPFAVVFGVWVALVDFLPLVGGLLAGVPTVAFAFLHSPTAGIVTLVVFLVYQQLENHVLNPLIMSKTVKLNPLWVILSVLAGAELAGIFGALLAIPAAGAIQVIARDIWDERRGERKDPPTVGPDEEPLP